MFQNALVIVKKIRPQETGSGRFLGVTSNFGAPPLIGGEDGICYWVDVAVSNFEKVHFEAPQLCCQSLSQK